jgi:hypothetical protein
MAGPNSSIFELLFIRGDSMMNPKIIITRMDHDLRVEIKKEYLISMDFIARCDFYIFDDDILILLHGRINGYPDNIQRDRFYRVSYDCDTICSYVPVYNHTCNLSKIPGQNNYYLGLFGSLILKVDSVFNPISVKPIEFDFTPQSRIFYKNNQELTIITTVFVYYLPYAQNGIIETTHDFNIPYSTVLNYGSTTLPNFLSSRSSIFITSDNNYIIGSFSGFLPSSSSIFWDSPNQFTVRSYSEDLNLNWDKTYGDPDSCYFITGIVEDNLGYVVAGFRSSVVDLLPDFDVFFLQVKS